MLREYDITPTNRRWPDGTQSKGYARADFTDAWDRYCPTDPDPTATDVHGREGDPYHPYQARHPRSERYGSESVGRIIRTGHFDPYHP